MQVNDGYCGRLSHKNLRDQRRIIAARLDRAWPGGNRQPSRFDLSQCEWRRENAIFSPLMGDGK
jgi:hypothetical protein